MSDAIAAVAYHRIQGRFALFEMSRPDKSNRVTCLGMLARFNANCGPVCKNSPKQMHFTVTRNYRRMNCDTLNEGNARWSLIRSESESGALNPMFLALFGFHADLDGFCVVTAWVGIVFSLNQRIYVTFRHSDAERSRECTRDESWKRLNSANKFQTLTRFKPCEIHKLVGFEWKSSAS